MKKLLGIKRDKQLKIILLIVFLTLLLFSGCTNENPSEVQETAGIGTNFLVAPEFQSIYENYGGMRTFGPPLTEEYVEVGYDREIQYFRNMRLEFDPELEEILITPLGKLSVPDEENQIPALVTAEGPESTGLREEFPVRDEFLNFYALHGGEPLFGAPITNELDEGGTRVQYFENARLEWHPDNTIGNRVQVGPLGEEHYRQYGIFRNPGRSRPLSSASVQEAVISTYFKSSILYGGDQQVIFVDVKTPDGQQPVSDVTVEISASYNDSIESEVQLTTDGLGHAQGVVELPGVEPGQKVLVNVTASNPTGIIIDMTTNSFMTWW